MSLFNKEKSITIDMVKFSVRRPLCSIYGKTEGVSSFSTFSTKRTSKGIRFHFQKVRFQVLGIKLYFLSRIKFKNLFKIKSTN